MKKKLFNLFYPDPSGYIYWFDNEEYRKFKNQTVYRIYFKETDRMNFAAQLITKPMGSSKIIHMGSLNDPNSYIGSLMESSNISFRRKQRRNFYTSGHTRQR